MITLYLGDPHARPNNLQEMRLLIMFLTNVAVTNNVKRIVILGDLFHTHDVLRLQVVEFWTWALQELNEVCETIVLKGNHDTSNDSNFHNSSSLAVYGLMGLEKISIINYPVRIGPFAYVPYIHDQSVFVAESNRLYDEGARVLVCHADWDGGQYENGFYAPNGVKPDALKFDLIIGGHIHKRQRFGKVILPGTPRWDTASDANELKGLWLVNHDDDTGTILSESFISTENVCKPIMSFSYKEGDPGIPAWPDNARVAVELIGSSAWVAQEKARLKGRCSVSSKITDTKKPVSRNPGKGFEDFLSNLFTSTMDRKELLEYAKEIGIV